MCGISGIINLNGAPVGDDQLSAMMKAMKHRGPDDDGTFAEGGVGLGFVRLSIIDLSPAGHQPMFSADERYVLIFNGEIFNYIELREELRAKGHVFRTRTDSEVLLTAYVEWGEQMLHRLNGMWAFVIYDRKEKTVFGARDRYGVKPFYYCVDGDRILFASEPPSILAVLGRKPTPNPNALFNYLAFNRTDQNDESFFQEIRKLAHGHYFKFALAPAPGALEPKRWYNLRNELKEPFKDPEAYRELFASSVGLRLRSDVPVGVCLSGGLDSSSIVSLLNQDHGIQDLHTFSAVYGQGRKGDESRFINLYQDQLKHMHYVYPDEKGLMEDLEQLTRAQLEPVPSTSTYAQFRVMRLAKENVTVTLDGQGADEALAGYHYFFGFHFKNLLRKGKAGALLSEMGHYYAKHRSLYGFKSLVFFLLPAFLRTRLRVMEKGYLDPGFFQTHGKGGGDIAGELYGSNSLQEALINHFEYKLEHLLKWEDRNSMWFSIEARVPFLDYRLVEHTLSLPDNRIIREGMTKHILREAMKGTLPEEIRMRRDKVGFETPEDEWFRTPLFQKYITELFGSTAFASRGVVDVKKVQEMYQKHLNRQGNYSREIWKLIHLEKWYNHFID
ncbi:MAG: asparagine synthase (glutamine-hydrolyzing) [Lewinellaceae bacterium]|nr:asparagine synthase (glutamine-hydrolyzing) [Lewinellaceae bacterium]